MQIFKIVKSTCTQNAKNKNHISLKIQLSLKSTLLISSVFRGHPRGGGANFKIYAYDSPNIREKKILYLSTNKSSPKEGERLLCRPLNSATDANMIDIKQ